MRSLCFALGLIVFIAACDSKPKPKPEPEFDKASVTSLDFESAIQDSNCLSLVHGDMVNFVFTEEGLHQTPIHSAQIAIYDVLTQPGTSQLELISSHSGSYEFYFAENRTSVVWSSQDGSRIKKCRMNQPSCDRLIRTAKQTLNLMRTQSKEPLRIDQSSTLDCVDRLLK